MPTDLRKVILKGRKQLAKDIVHSLTEEGPWWTGTFGENWVVSKTPVKPTRKRSPQTAFYDVPDPTGSVCIANRTQAFGALIDLGV